MLPGHLFKNENTQFAVIFKTKLHISLCAKNDTSQNAYLAKSHLTREKCIIN